MVKRKADPCSPSPLISPMGEPPAAIRIAFKKIGCHRKRFEIQSCQNRLADYYLAIHFHLQIRLVIEEKLQVQRRQRSTGRCEHQEIVEDERQQFFAAFHLFHFNVLE